MLPEVTFFIFRCAGCHRRVKVSLPSVPRIESGFAKQIQRQCHRCWERKIIPDIDVLQLFIDTGERRDGTGKRVEILTPAFLN